MTKRRKPSLFDHFIVLRMDTKGNSGFLKRVKIRMRMSTRSKRDEPLPKSLVRFCFPEEDVWPSQLQTLEHFVFTITNSDTSRTYGFCKRHRVINDAIECLCILSPRPLWSILHPFLDIIQCRWILEPSGAIGLLKQISKTHLPEPGSILKLPCEPHPYKLAYNAIQRPYLHTLFSHLSIDDIIWLLGALMLEQRIIITSSSLGVISDTIHSLISLLSPFHWEHIFIPILPSSLAHYISAPMPFIVGTQSNVLEQLLKMQIPLESVCIVDLDNGSLQMCSSTNDSMSNPIPTLLSNKLRRKLGDLVPHAGSQIKKMGMGAYKRMTNKEEYYKSLLVDDNEIYDAFYAFHVFCFGGYKQFSSVIDGKFKLNVQKFLSNCSSDDQEVFQFFQAVCHSQMFIQFVESRCCNEKAVHDRFDRVCSQLRSAEDFRSYSRILFVVSEDRKLFYRSVRDTSAFQATFQLTSNKSSNSSRLIAFLIDKSYNTVAFTEILNALFSRLDDCTGKNWRHAMQALSMLKQLLVSGSDQSVSACITSIGRLKAMRRFRHRESEVQELVRQEADELCALICNVSQIRARKLAVWGVLEDIEEYLLIDEVDDVVASSEVCDVIVKGVSKDDVLEEGFVKYALYRKQSCEDGEGAVIPGISELHESFRPSEFPRGVVVDDMLGIGSGEVFDLLNFGTAVEKPAYDVLLDFNIPSEPKPSMTPDDVFDSFFSF